MLGSDIFGKHGREVTLIKMAYTYELPNVTGGFDSALVDIVSTVPAFIPMLLLTIYCVVMIGGMIAQRTRTGTSDLPLWSTLGALSTLMVALPITTIVGIIQPTYLVVIVLITIMSGVWLFLNQNRNEV